jgi:hypothetical protein
MRESQPWIERLGLLWLRSNADDASVGGLFVIRGYSRRDTVRYWGKFAKHLLILRSSQFDPSY